MLGLGSEMLFFLVSHSGELCLCFINSHWQAEHQQGTQRKYQTCRVANKKWENSMLLAVLRSKDHTGKFTYCLMHCSHNKMYFTLIVFRPVYQHSGLWCFADLTWWQWATEGCEGTFGFSLRLCCLISESLRFVSNWTLVSVPLEGSEDCGLWDDHRSGRKQKKQILLLRRSSDPVFFSPGPGGLLPCMFLHTWLNWS